VFKHLLIATDGSELADKAVEKGLTLSKQLGAKVTIVTVTEPWTAAVTGEMGLAFPIEEYEEGCAANAAKILTAAEAMAKSSGASYETLHIKNSFPAEGIVEAAKARSCDLIVMASHGRRGLSRMLLGSQANEVLTHSAIPVLIWR
jgi:nucleotide-binding universal stress UspA family protein